MPITHGWTTAASDNPAHDVSADELNGHTGTEDHAHTATADGGVLTSPEVSAKLLLNEQGSDPASPAATKWVLYVKSGGVYAKNSAGTVVGPLAPGITNPMTTKGDVIVADTGGTPTRVAATTAGFVLTSNGAAQFPSWQAAGGLLVEVTRTLTSTEIKNLFSTPITLVAGVANTAYWPVALQVVFRYGGTQYANVGTVIRVGAPEAAANFANPVQVDTAILAEIADAIAYGASVGGPSWVLSDVEGQPLEIFCSGSNPTTGNGTLDVWVLYRVTTV